jgi:sugar phosphate isomerase/epimerase
MSSVNNFIFPIAAITDEYDPGFDRALEPMTAAGMTGAELRVVFGKNIMDLTDDEVKRAVDRLAERGIRVVSLATPLLKCVLPGAPEVDTRFQQDIFNSRHTFDDQPRLAERAIALAGLTGARIVRVFSYWRSVEPERCFDGVVKALEGLAAQFGSAGLICGLENEHACNIATAAESARVLSAIPHPALQLVWDPANALCSGEEPYPAGYALLPKSRIAHVHIKDCHIENHKPIWGPVGTRAIDWKGQLAALKADGYAGFISLETHWPGPNGDKFLASVISGQNLRGLVTAAA